MNQGPKCIINIILALGNNNNSSFSNQNNLDIKITTPVKLAENQSSSKLLPKQPNTHSNNKTASVPSSSKPSNNLMNNFMLKNKDVEKIVPSNNSHIKNNLASGGINFNNNINYLNLVSNLGNNAPNERQNKKFK
jgi:hypothetical protein